uniref:hypothetical protein n=1 Tax=Arsukibacterium sp. TaxID=1977258 RepID=UPI002FDB1950
MPTAMIGPKFYAWDDNGNPLAFGKVHTYQAGTNKRKATFTGENGETANSNPVILNASGYASIYLAGAYKIVVTDANDVPVWSADPVTDVTQRQSDFINERDAAYLGPKKIRINGDATAFYEIGRAVRVALSTGFQYGFVRSAQYGADFTIIDLNGPVSLDPSVVSAAGGLVTSALFGGFPAEQVADFGFLRQELNENSGAELVRTADGRTVQKRFDELGDDYLTLATGDQVLDDHNQDTKAHPALTNFLVKLTQDAQTAADVAMFDSNIYETVLLGIANTAPGEFFYVVSEQDDEFVVLYKNVSDSGTGVLRTVAFAGSEATKTLAADAYNSVYNAGFSVEVDGLAPGEPGFLSVVLFGKRSGGSFTQLASETYSSNLDGTTASYPGQSLSGVLLNAGENAVFKLELTTGTTGTLTVGNLTYQEGNPADAADPIKTFPTANAMQAFIQSATNEADRAKTEADRAQAAADAAEATSIAYAVDAAAAQAAIDADVLSVDNAAIFAKALIDGYEQSVETEAINAINAIESLGWLPVGTFAAGFTFTSLLDVGLDNDGNWWSWSGEFPQVVDAGTDPTLNPNFKLRGDGVLRSDLAAPGSDVLIADVEAQQVAFTSDLVRYGASLSQPQFGGLTPTKQNAILKISDTRYRAFVHLGGRTWQVCDLVNSGLDSEGNTTPYGWSKTDVNDYVEPIVWGDAGVTSSGSSFELTSTDSVPYIGHKALQLQAVAAYIEVELTVNQAGANLYLNYT